MEIERKWLLNEIPNLPILEHGHIEQFYLSMKPEVRIRRYVVLEGKGYAPYRLTIKGEGSLSREEMECEISEEFYRKALRMVNKCPIFKDYWALDLDGRCLEVSVVEDKFIYAEIEFPTVEEAEAYSFPLADAIDITYDSRYKMKKYWKQTRL